MYVLEIWMSYTYVYLKCHYKTKVQHPICSKWGNTGYDEMIELGFMENFPKTLGHLSSA
jgi:hypothetical protein